jgi:putative RecB family exonuclease
MGGFAVSNVTFLSPSRLATYADCQRKFDYGYMQEIEAPDETRLYLNQGLAYHETIEAVCGATEPDDDPETISDRAMEAFPEKWDEHLDPGEYASRAHQEYQRRENRAAIESFFDPDGGDGIEHARRSIATERWLECVRDGLGLHGKADNVLRTDEGLHIIDYKRTVNGVLGHWSGDRLVDHLEQESYEVDRVKNAFQTATYVEGIKQSRLYEEGMSIRFSFYGLLHDRNTKGTPEGLYISVNGKSRETTKAYEEYHDTIWSLIAQAHYGITNEEYSPTPFTLIRGEACPECDYRTMCADHLSTEVRR